MVLFYAIGIGFGEKIYRISIIRGLDVQLALFYFDTSFGNVLLHEFSNVSG